MDSNRVAPSLRFGVFEMDLRTGELRKSGVLIHLGPQPFKVLALLAGKPGELVTREEIQREIWGETTFVDYEQGLRVAIKKIRAALGDSSVSPRYIETLSRRGYRFIAHVETVPPASAPADAGADSVSVQAVPPAPPAKPPWNRWLWAGGVAIAFALVLIALNVGRIRGRLFDAVEARPHAPVLKIRSLAVLPLENVSGERSQDFFSTVLTDELTTDLTEIPSLRVVSRTSAMVYKEKQTPLSQIARVLDVDAVVEGTAMRDGGRVRITAQLIDARKDKSLWSGSFEGQATDVLQLEDNVARQIASYITASISSPRAPVLRPHPAQPTNPAAQDAYWRGRILFDRRQRQVGGEESAIGDFRKAIKIDPRYARAYAGLAQALLSQSYLQAARAKDVIGKARNAAERALELDPNLSEAYCALGMIQGSYDYDWEGAEKSFHRSLELNPNNSLSEIFLSDVLTAEGRSQDAVAHARRALELDPLSFFANRNLASSLYFARRYDKALAQLQRTRVLEDNPGVIDNWIGWIDEVRGKYDLAEKYNLKLLTDKGVPPAQLARYRAAYRRGGWKGYWWAQLHDQRRPFPLRRNGSCVGYYVGLANLNMGSKDAALVELNRAVNQHCVWTMWLKVDPRLDSLHSDPRFGKLLGRLNLAPTAVSANR